jgi:hypothetical protein
MVAVIRRPRNGDDCSLNRQTDQASVFIAASTIDAISARVRLVLPTTRNP